MIGPSIPKEILEERRKQSSEKKYVNDSSDDSNDSDDEIAGPQLPEFSYKNSGSEKESVSCKEKNESNKKAENKNTSKVELEHSTGVKQSLMSKHQLKDRNKHKITKFDSKENLNSEVRKEILRRLDQNGGLEGKFTRGS